MSTTTNTAGRWNGRPASTKPGPKISQKASGYLTTNWDDFPKLFFYDTKHTYVYGLDPNYLYSQNPELYKLLKDLTEGKIDDPAPMIRDKFGANYIFADAKENTDMIAKALESGWVETVYEDDEARLLKIRAVKGEPPEAAKDQETPDEKKILDDEEKKDDNDE